MSRKESRFLGYPRRFTDFNLDGCPEGVAYALRVGEDPVRRGCVLFESVAVGPLLVEAVHPHGKLPYHVGRQRVDWTDPAYETMNPKYRPTSTGTLMTMGDIGAIEMAAKVFRGECIWAIFADWIEDDPAGHVFMRTAHPYPGHRIDPDPVGHFLQLLRRYRERRKIKPKG